MAKKSRAERKKEAEKKNNGTASANNSVKEIRNRN